MTDRGGSDSVDEARQDMGGRVTTGSASVPGGRATAASARSTSSLLSEGAHRGNWRLLDGPLMALFCSNRCPGDLVLKTYDLARAMRNAGVPVVGGFQTPMEKECLRLLLRGSQPVVVCPARSIEHMRIPREWRPALDEGRLLILSPFPATVRRPTVKIAAERNDLVVTLATQVFIAHAAEGSRTEALARGVVSMGKPLFTLDGPANANLLALGAHPTRVDSEGMDELLSLAGPPAPATSS